MSNEAAVILITGCSTGFGRELALAALTAGLRVIATARRPETLASLHEKGAKTLRLDVTASTEELKQFASEALLLFGQVDYLVNNAGFLQGGAIEENTPEENIAQFNTHFFGVINLTSALLPHLRERKCGTIVNAALDALSDTWARELAPFNIRSISIQLGSFRTSVAESGNLKVASASIDGYHAKIIELISVDPERALPMRLAIGEDSYENAKTFYEKQLEDLEKWKAVSTGTDVRSIDETVVRDK
ncbi:hypothetical protein B0H13DRAFT_2327951 [Mycena leptocephala]|nr:hypothetical protein B0H13DRAFT_2327951 [Mycena leptocephala]